jgi:hypothetical protein
LDIIPHPVFYLKTFGDWTLSLSLGWPQSIELFPISGPKNLVSWAQSIELDPIKSGMMDNVQKVSNCINTPSSHAFKASDI